MANLYGLTKTDPVNAPAGIVGQPGVAIILKEGFTVPSTKNGTIGGSLTVSGALNVSGITTLSNTLNNTANTTNLSTLTVSGTTSFSNTVTFNSTAKIASHILPNSTSGLYNLGNGTNKWGVGYFNSIQTDDLTVTTNLTTQNLTVNGSLTLPSSISLTNALIAGTVTASVSLTAGYLTVNNPGTSTNYIAGQTTFGGQVLFSSTGSINSKILPSFDNIHELGSSSYRWKDGYFANLTPSTIKFAATNSTNLDFYASGSFNATLTSGTASVVFTIYYVRIGNAVILSSPAQVIQCGASGSNTTLSIPNTNFPAIIKPVSTGRTCSHIVFDSSTYSHGRVFIATDGTITFYKDAGSTAFTSGVVKGINGFSAYYTID